MQDSLETVDILEAETIQLYNLLENYKIYIQPTDLAMFQTLSPTIRSLKEAVEIAVDTKEDNINKFTGDLEKLLTDLSSEVSEIRNAAQDPMVLNSSSNNDEVIAYLEDLRRQLERVEVLKSKYESWGRLFKSGGKKATDSEEGQAENAAPEESNEDIEMEETKKEVELKNSLWSSLKDWDRLAE